MVTREFRVGDKVTCNIFGKGIVVSIHKGCVLPVGVKFENVFINAYTIDGKISSLGKRSLFIIPKRKPTLSEVKAKYKELLNSVEEVEFKESALNYCIYFYKENGQISIYVRDNYETEWLDNKYFSKKDADMIVEEMNKFIETEV